MKIALSLCLTLACLFLVQTGKAQESGSSVPPYKILEIYEGTNKWFIPALILEADGELSKDDLILIREDISKDKSITEHSAFSCYYVIREDGVNKALFYRDTRTKPFEDVYILLSEVREHIQSVIDQGSREIDISDCYIGLKAGQIKTIYHAFEAGERPSDMDSTQIHGFWYNSTGYGNEAIRTDDGGLILRDFLENPIETAKLIPLASGDYVRYSLKHKGYTKYYLKLAE